MELIVIILCDGLLPSQITHLQVYFHKQSHSHNYNIAQIHPTAFIHADDEASFIRPMIKEVNTTYEHHIWLINSLENYHDRRVDVLTACTLKSMKEQDFRQRNRKI